MGGCCKLQPRSVGSQVARGNPLLAKVRGDSTSICNEPGESSLKVAIPLQIKVRYPLLLARKRIGSMVDLEAAK